jgi:hypothetical protein
MANQMEPPVETVSIMTKFPQEFLQAMDDQSTDFYGMGANMDKQVLAKTPLAARPSYTMATPTLDSFQTYLDSEWPASTLMDALLVHLCVFAHEGACVADRVLQESEQMVRKFKEERAEQQAEIRDLHADCMDPWSIEGIVEDSITTRLQKISNNMNALALQLEVTSVALTAMFSFLDRKLEEFKCNQCAFNNQIEASLQTQNDQTL